MSVKSSITVAGSVSASFSKSASALNSINASTSVASRTNVAGNERAKTSTVNYGKGLKQLSTSIVSAGDAIHSVAKDFATIDQQASKQFQSNSLGNWLK
ncbi:TIGR04197 family type VII secretion effector [Enterococcus termitis]|uniref:Type VII secretion effector n=1 Tax=Enterococcus termitis TaxID=332950 RepID=A0A1E5H752_9ENTE|nr:TIGR04197 family type VII secretion effector [Enterococcus termitis]OEG20753.1 hypothetical protein BCR25_02775 [Enterococcus termitis]OJG99665.1 type VII secretion effector [Enterococcus termitis]